MSETKTCSIYFEKELYKKLSEIAKEDDRSLNWLINKIAKDYISKIEGNSNR